MDDGNRRQKPTKPGAKTDSGSRANSQVVKKAIDIRWAVKITVLTFSISVVLSLLANTSLSRLSIIFAFVILLLFILLGVVFDIIGIAAATATEESFHSMSARRIPGAKEAVMLVRQADKVSNFCNDVVGDIAGIMSGSTTAAIITILVKGDGVFSLVISLVFTALVSAVTVGSKAVGKGIAMNHCIYILSLIGRIIYNIKKINPFRFGKKN